jgi:hypothetical protein
MNEFEPLRPWQVIGGIALALFAAAWLFGPLFYIGSM